LRIGVDASCWANDRGYGRFTREVLRLLPGLAPDDEFVCFVDPSLATRFDLKAPNVRTVVVELGASPTEAASADGHRAVRDLLRFTRAVYREPLDVFFSPSVYTYFPLPPGLRALVTIHDAIAERFPELTLPSRRARIFWNSKVRLAIWQSRLVLTVSDYSARELASVLEIDRSRIRVALEAPAPAFRPSESQAAITAAAARAGLPDHARWITYVGGFNPHKRVDVLVRAHGALVQELGAAAPYLVLVGAATRDSFHKNVDAIEREIAAAGSADFVRWAGYVEDEELRHLHSGALALVLPSECEGFGLPAIEAAACGSPVVATLESPLPELLAGGGVFVKPGDEQGLIDALRHVLTNEPARKIMGSRAHARACDLTWSRSASAVLAALREAAGRGDLAREHTAPREYRQLEVAR
jgi:glycosyltransferase involved in cell wall biosynthesis